MKIVQLTLNSVVSFVGLAAIVAAANGCSASTSTEDGSTDDTGTDAKQQEGSGSTSEESSDLGESTSAVACRRPNGSPKSSCYYVCCLHGAYYGISPYPCYSSC
jgi:hypothetical protein